MLKLVKRLLDTGIPLTQLSAAVSHLSSRDVADFSQVTLMSDGESVYECTSPDEVVDLLCGGQRVFGIALGRLCEEVNIELRSFPKFGRPASLEKSKLVESRDGDECGNVAWPDGGEVPQVYRRNGDDPEPLADSDHRSIGAAKPEIGILTNEG